MKGDIPIKGGIEFDMLTPWRRVCHSNRGRSRFAKRKYARRSRHVARLTIRNER